MGTTTAGRGASATEENQAWLERAMPPYFFDAMNDEPEAMAILARELGTLRANENLVLADRPGRLILATRNVPGSLYRTLTLGRASQPAISYAMFAHSSGPMPGMEQGLEIQRYDYECKTDAEIAQALAAGVRIPADVRRAVAAAVERDYRDLGAEELDRLLAVLWLNNASYVRISPPRRVAQTLRLLQSGARTGGLYLDVDPMTDGSGLTRVSFAVASAPHRGFLAQVMEVLNRLDLGVNRAYVLDVSTGQQPFALLMFYLRPRKGPPLRSGSALHRQLEREIFNTQILDTASPFYEGLVRRGIMSGEDASLVGAFAAFCHTNLAHAESDRFGWEEVQDCFLADPDLAARLVRLFRTRFDPALRGREKAWAREVAEAERTVRDYDTGHRHLDDLRRAVFRCALAFIRHTLKTNFFVREKQAFAFRLDPAYLAALGPAAVADLPPERPFRVTFFFTRGGFGFHVGFSDIARGGWRTVVCRTADDFLTNAATLFRENYVLAHTQHLKNKDIYEGGSKLVMLMDASGLERAELDQEVRRLHKLQRGVFDAFLDVFVTREGVARDARVVDYYREDEPIELGPDENMHDDMIEEIAEASKRRGYILGIGVMSSKRVGINHKEYGVTSTGVVKFAEITMKELGVDMRRDAFRVKLTGGPNGDVAGNAMRILLDRCPRVRLVLILDGTAALCDPEGADRTELRRILLRQDLDAFDPRALHPGGFLLFRTGRRREGLRELYRKVTRSPRGLQERWISLDEFSREFGALPFTVPADLFIPGGGRPETVDRDNWERFLLPDGTPSARAIVEGANSFITPEARVQLQRRGVLVMRDASANKCGVISSSYEIIANLTLDEEEFLAAKARYVKGVLDILERRAAEEAHLILRRRREGGQLCTEISDAVSREINGHYARLFRLFQARPELAQEPAFQRVILAHLPAMMRRSARLRRRIGRLPQKYRSAILAAEIGSSMVYRGDLEADLEDAVRLHVQRHFAA